MSRGIPIRAFALALLLLCTAGVARAQDASVPGTAEEREAARKLEAVRAEIVQLTQAQRAREGERGDATRALREADQEVNREARALHEVEAELALQAAELARLEAARSDLTARLVAQRAVLAQLLRSAYALGRHEQLRLLLAQDRIEELARVLAYHRYFQRDRVARIERLRDELRELARLGEAVTAKQLELAASRSVREQRIAELEVQRRTRRELLATLETQFKDAQSRLAALGRDERALLRLLESLRDVFADIPRQIDQARPFGERRGALRRPLPGKVLSGFGRALPDGRTSQGWLIGADAGATVGAIAPGRVAFADWLKGYGLLVIVDHGDGWMSLYAQNDSVLREVGEWVGPGDALAGVGSSGGQSAAALYFELRRKGQPVDPNGWFAGP